MGTGESTEVLQFVNLWGSGSMPLSNFNAFISILEVIPCGCVELTNLEGEGKVSIGRPKIAGPRNGRNW